MVLKNDALSALPWKLRGSIPDLQKDEKMLRVSRHHWMKYVFLVSICVFLLALCVAFLFIIPSLRETYVALATVAFFAAVTSLIIVHHWFFHSLLSEHVTDIILTNKRLLYLTHRLWLADTMDELALQKIKMVEVHKRGFLRHLLNYGDLSCLFDVDAGKTIHFVPVPQAWARMIESRMDIG